MNQAQETVSVRAEWVGRHEIESIDGALKPCAYVARAYKYTKENGTTPVWARKVDDQWRFMASYIESDARRNSISMSVHDAAVMLGATRRAIQIWVDAGEIPLLDAEQHDKGIERRILREPFLQNIEILKKRLETPSVVARKLNNGHFVPPDVLNRVKAECEARHERVRKQDRERLKVWRETEAAKAHVASESGHAAPKQVVALNIENRLKTAMKARVGAAAAAEQKAIKAFEHITEKGERLDATKRKTAIALEDRLRKALETPRVATPADPHLVEKAEKVGREILDRMYDEDFSRVKAMIMFSQATQSLGIPQDIRIRVSRRVFGEGGGK